MILFTTKSYDYLGKAITNFNDIREGKISTKTFGDGEKYHKLETNVEGQETVLIGGTIDDSETLELYDLASTLIHYGASALTIVIPYFGYSTMERSSKIGEAVKAKYRARMFSSLPNSPKGTRIFLFDLHSEGIPYYFEGDLRPFHIYLKDIILSECLQRYPNKNFVLGSVDAGRAKWVESLAEELQVTPAYILKRRTEKGTSITSLNADVNGKNVIIYDDMIRSGSSTVNAAKRYKEEGASEIHVIASHGLFTKGCIELIDETESITSVVCTDTHPASLQATSNKLKVVSVAALVNEKISKHIY
ncbi:MAG: ribose-phosphate diphosphokinase [Flavobacteriales bacterium]|nr:ribose-phosphate diphosphokinase [Flavobacteriales bacterium]